MVSFSVIEKRKEKNNKTKQISAFGRKEEEKSKGRKKGKKIERREDERIFEGGRSLGKKGTDNAVERL